MNDGVIVLRSARVALLIGLVTMAAAGCSQPDATETEALSSTQSSNGLSHGMFTLTVGGVEDFERELATHRGKVVVVDFWATWCIPCVKQFPKTVSLANKYSGRGLAVIGVSLNQPDEEPKVRAVLERTNAPFANVLSRYSGAAAATEAFGLPGPVPYYRIYDRLGELRHEFSVDPLASRQFSHADIEEAVLQLLSSGK